MQLIATCAFGLERLVYNEIKSLGLWVVKTEDGRVTFEGDESAIVNTNRLLRCADRVQIKIGEFPAATFDELFDQVNALEWESYIGITDAFPVDATSVKSTLHSEPAIQSITKKAIVKRLQQKHKTDILPENSGAIYQIMVKANKDQFVVCIDTSGESLHKRGYRTKANLAPMKETLAAGIVKLSDWTIERALAGRTLVDPFCGSGTIAIEAAMIAHNIAPGSKRAFAFQNWGWMKTATAAKAAKSAKAEKPAPAANVAKATAILCSDIDPATIKIAKKNAANAGVAKDITFECSDFNDLDFSKFKNCTFITNPPYGERLEDTKHVEEMYRQFGKAFAKTKNCSLFLLTANENFPRLFGRPADKNRKLFNGNIRCYLFSYFSTLQQD
ncbi:MAG: class I SAM-dependent RNA methyltransferase [Candidatus Gracilibacteria bacterium]